MTDNNRDKWYRLPKVNYDKITIKRHMRKVEDATVRHAHKFIVKRWSSVHIAQRHIISWLLIMGILIAATGLQLMWFQRSYKTNALSNDGTYAEAVLGPIDTLNPLYASTSAERSASYLMFSSILRYDKSGNLNYDIANDVKVNAANTVYTVKIRSDIKWHDDTNLSASDIAFTVGLMKNPNARTTISGWKDIEVKVVDDTTIDFILPSTYAAFKHALTFPIVPEHILGKIAATSIRENSFSQNPIGSGPFKLNFVKTSNSDRKVIYMTRNDGYYRGRAELARFQLHSYETTEAIVRALSLNEVNAAADLLPIDTEHIDSNRYTITSEPINSAVYALINMKSVFLKGDALRLALQVGTNAGAIRDKLPSDTRALDLPFIDGQLKGDIPKAPQFDIDKSKKILEDDGWKLNSNNIREKDGKELKLSLVTMKNSEFETVLEVIVGQWRALGINIETKVVDPNDTTQNVAQNILQSRNFDVLIYKLNIGADPDVYPYWHSSQANPQGSNFSNYVNTISDDALTSARVRVEPELRNAKYITFCKQWLADIPAIGLYQSTAQYVSSVGIGAYDSSSVLVSSIDRYSDVLEWSAGSRSVYKTP